MSKVRRVFERGVSRYYDENGQLHNDGDLPAVDVVNGNKEWWKHGVLHRDGGEPAVVNDEKRVKAWFVNGVQHRDGGPALISPTVEKWYVNGVLHRLNGPAVSYFRGDYKLESVEYWIEGRSYTEADYKEEFERRLATSLGSVIASLSQAQEAAGKEGKLVVPLNDMGRELLGNSETTAAGSTESADSVVPDLVTQEELDSSTEEQKPMAEDRVESPEPKAKKEKAPKPPKEPKAKKEKPEKPAKPKKGEESETKAE